MNKSTRCIYKLQTLSKTNQIVCNARLNFDKRRNEKITTITAMFICDAITKKCKVSENDLLYIKKRDIYYLFASRISELAFISESRFEVLGAVNTFIRV